jgi:hypothetical protein
MTLAQVDVRDERHEKSSALRPALSRQIATSEAVQSPQPIGTVSSRRFTGPSLSSFTPPIRYRLSLRDPGPRCPEIDCTRC